MLKDYVLSAPADEDLEDILEYSIENFGVNQAIRYFKEIHTVCEKLVLQELIGIIRTDISEGQRSLVHKRHIIFYHIDEEKSIIRIDRIIHGNRDLSKEFK